MAQKSLTNTPIKDTPTPKKKSLVSRKKTPDDYATCLECGSSKEKTEFFKSYNNTIGVIPICKECFHKKVVSPTGIIDVNKLKLMLKDKNVDKPFVTKYWNASMQSKVKNKVGEYFRLINSGDTKTHTWLDSDDKETLPERITTQDEAEYVVKKTRNKETFVITEDIIKKWGLGYELQEYTMLESIYDKLLKDFDIESNIQEEYFKNAVVAQMRNLQCLSSDNVSGAEKWGKQFDSYMASGNLKPNQISALDKMGGVESFSMFFHYVEKSESFIPTFPDIILDDIDYAIYMFLNYNRTLAGLSEITLGEVKDFMTYDYERGQEIIFPTKKEDEKCKKKQK